MTSETLRKANELQEQIHSLELFILQCEHNRKIRFYKKRALMATVSDYMSETSLYECTPRTRDIFILALKQELAELQDEFKKLGGEE